MPVNEASSTETPYGRYITSEGWFVLNLEDALAVRNDEKGGAAYPIEARGVSFPTTSASMCASSRPASRMRSTTRRPRRKVPRTLRRGQLIVEEEERPLRQWDYFHCPPDTRHVIIGAGDGQCAILMLGARPDEPILYPVSEGRRSTAHPSRRRRPNRTRRMPTGRASTSRCAFRGRSTGLQGCAGVDRELRRGSSPSVPGAGLRSM